jgi:hypothetical protein
MFELSTETVTFPVQLIDYRGEIGHDRILAAECHVFTPAPSVDAALERL